MPRLLISAAAGVPLSLSELPFFHALGVWVVKLYAGGACRAFTGFYLRVLPPVKSVGGSARGCEELRRRLISSRLSAVALRVSFYAGVNPRSIYRLICKNAGWLYVFAIIGRSRASWYILIRRLSAACSL